MADIKINGININAQNVKELKPNMTLPVVQKAIDGDGFDSVVFQKGDKAYIAYSQDGMDFGGLKNLKQGSVPTMKQNGQDVKLILFDNEINGAGEGALRALDNMKTVAIGGAGFMAKSGIGIVSGGATLVGFAAIAKGVGLSGAMAMAKPLVGAAVKGLGKAGLYGLAAVAIGTALYTGGSAIYGATRGTEMAGINHITK